jgi:asparagine synthase (glutamine-hydrolysing)
LQVERAIREYLAQHVSYPYEAAGYTADTKGFWTPRRPDAEREDIAERLTVMGGIAGILNRGPAAPPFSREDISAMLASIRHRGPDQFGIYLDDCAGLGSARLSIIDPATGQQPIGNEDATMWIVFNGEVFNYVELRPWLEARGHRLATHTGSEIVLHLFEELGPDCLGQLNGQFAFAIWDTRTQTLFLARDRLGIRPLFYRSSQRQFVFASEVKAILNATPGANLDPLALDEIFTFCSTLGERTPFENIRQLLPGHYMLVSGDRVVTREYWRLDFAEPGSSVSECDADRALEEFRELLIDSVRLRLRADVPVGAYLSGGLDSSSLAAIVGNYTGNRLDTFSIAFSDPEFDESVFQNEVAAKLGTRHHVVKVGLAGVAEAFFDAVWHTETPLLRTAPAAMLLLASSVHARGFKAVLTGEGADEFLAGCDIFKEAAIRRFWARQPKSKMRPRLLRTLYPEIAGLTTASHDLLAAFFRGDLTGTGLPHYSHGPRWRNTARAKRFFSDEMKAAIGPDRRCVAEIEYPVQFFSWGPLQRAQYLEASLFLPQYLLSSQGDRMSMACSVEGRYPFLDHRLVEFCNRLPANLKLRGLIDKYLLRRMVRDLLPASIRTRPKRPHRAPVHQAFFGPDAPEYVMELLSGSNLERMGLFCAAAVQRLVHKARRTGALSQADDMALAGILSTQLLHHHFVDHFHRAEPLGSQYSVKLCGPPRAVRRRPCRSGFRPGLNPKEHA